MLTPDTILQGRYRVVRQLGQGGMGAVYEAIDQRLDTTVALKETLFAEERLRKQFEREARLLARLHHPALPRVSDHFSEGDDQFLVMQFIPGDDLAEMMARKSGPFPASQVLTWADQLLDALDYLHTQNPQIVHRDIKPQNLKLTARGQIILLDFGLAKGQAGEISRVTAASIFGYTPNYAPLEQIQGLGTDSRSDLYALAATLYHLMTGVKPPDALTRAAALVNGQPDPLLGAHEANAEVGVEVAQVLQKAMSQNREQRYATAADMRKALHGTDQVSTVTNRSEAQTVLLPPSEHTLTSPTQPVVKQPTIRSGETTVVRRADGSPKRQPLFWLLPVAAVAILAACLTWYFGFRNRTDAVVQVAPTPTPIQATSTASPVPTPAQGVAGTGETEKKPTPSEQPTPKKPERTAATEPKKQRTQTREPSPPTAAEGHNQTAPPREVPQVPQVDPPNRPRRGTTRVMAGGVVIRTFADGSQMITTPDGMRVYVSPDGKRQILRTPQRKNQNQNRGKAPQTP